MAVALGSSSRTGSIGPMLEPFETPTDRRPAARPSAARPRRLRRPTDRPRPTTGTRDARDRAHDPVRVDVDRAAGVDLDHEDLRVVAVRGVHRVDGSAAAFGGSMRPSTWMTSMRPRCSRDRAAPALAGAEQRRRTGPSDDQRPARDACRRWTARRAPVGSGRWSWRSSAPPPASSSLRARVASARPPSPPRWPSAAARAGMSVLIVEVEGKSGLADRVRPPGPRLRRDRARARDPGPHPHPRRRARRLAREQRAEADLEAARADGRARRGRDRGARA